MTTQVTSIDGNGQRLDGGAMFGNVPRPLWEKWIKPDDRHRIPLACRALLIEHEDKKILCETGIGAFFEPKLADRFGVDSPDRHILLENLARCGVRDDEINYVILSHLHFDHTGGLLPTYDEMQKGKTELLFPNAQYVVGEEAWERAVHPHARDRASFIPEIINKLKDSGRLRQMKKGETLEDLPIEFFYSSGHTPGQMHTVFHGTKRSIVFCGDLVPGVAWMHVPVTMGYDRYPELLIDEKQKLYERALKEKWILFFTHDPQKAGAIATQNEKKRISAESTFDQFLQTAL